LARAEGTDDAPQRHSHLHPLERFRGAFLPAQKKLST